MLLNWVIPANGSQEIFRRIASTYQQAEAFSGAFSQHAERKQADIFEWRRVMLDDMAKERAPQLAKKRQNG
ncbi:hypothetical protein QKW52_10940 [Bacillus sonorensis]|nr:hypothetical protein [Bacillus sonorensis]